MLKLLSLYYFMLKVSILRCFLTGGATRRLLPDAFTSVFNFYSLFSLFDRPLSLFLGFSTGADYPLSYSSWALEFIGTGAYSSFFGSSGYWESNSCLFLIGSSFWAWSTFTCELWPFSYCFLASSFRFWMFFTFCMKMASLLWSIPDEGLGGIGC